MPPKGPALNLLLPNPESISSLQGDVAGFEALAAHLLRLTGIHLPSNSKNLSLMACRLNPVLRDRNLETYSSYLELLATGEPRILAEFVSALTTNTTEFFREDRHFQVLKDVLPGLIRAKLASGGRELRVWCAAASTGQEPYTIAMTLVEALGDPGPLQVKFLASDIDVEVLRKGAAGVYRANEVQGVPAMYLQKYFVRRERGSEQAYQVRPLLMDMITFAQFNLMSRPFPFQHKFDIVFCRNVLIYFQRETSVSVVQQIAGVMAPGGYLFLGHSESGLSHQLGLKSIASAVYQKG